jgi:hypothetical protein
MHMNKTGKYTYTLYNAENVYRVTHRQDGFFVEPMMGTAGRGSLVSPEALDEKFPGALAEIRKLAYR